MRLTILLLLGLFFSSPTSVDGQIVQGLKPKPFSARNSRISAGLLFNANRGNDEGKTFLNTFTGSLPEDYSIRFDTLQGLPYFSAGLVLDWFAPNSRLGFMFGAEYNSTAFQIHDDSDIITAFKIQRVSFPAYLKMKFGNIHAPTNFLVMLGGLYAVPIKYSRTRGTTVSTSKEETRNTFSLSSIIGAQIRFSGNDKIQQEIVDGELKTEFARMWLFVRTDLVMNNIFDPESQVPLIPNLSNSKIDYRDLNITLGFAIFLGSK